MYLDASNRLHRSGSGTMECPHCRHHSHMSPTATPDFRAIQSARPATVGIVFHCDACATPVFMRLRVNNISESRIDFNPLPQPVEQSDERFGFSYLPDKVELLFRDALGCYRNNLLQAFAAMCRLTAQAVFSDLGEGSKLKIFDEVDDIARMAEIDDDLFRAVRNIIFDTNTDSLYFADGLDRGTAAILLETMKDVLHQTYIRNGRLRKAMQMRQFFAGEAHNRRSSKVARLVRGDRTTGTG